MLRQTRRGSRDVYPAGQITRGRLRTSDEAKFRALRTVCGEAVCQRQRRMDYSRPVNLRAAHATAAPKVRTIGIHD